MLSLLSPSGNKRRALPVPHIALRTATWLELVAQYLPTARALVIALFHTANAVAQALMHYAQQKAKFEHNGGKAHDASDTGNCKGSRLDPTDPTVENNTNKVTLPAVKSLLLPERALLKERYIVGNVGP